jgi:hypothetical protein
MQIIYLIKTKLIKIMMSIDEFILPFPILLKELSLNDVKRDAWCPCNFEDVLNKGRLYILL